MTVDEKSRIRKSAARRFAWITSALVLVSLFVVGARVAQERIADNYARGTLARESAALTREFMRYDAGRGQELALRPPPDNALRREIWARHIEDQLDQPAAVCIIDHPALMWIRKPSGFEISADSVSLMLTSPEASTKSATLSSYGDVHVLHSNFQIGSDFQSLWLFNRGSDSLNWGVLLSSNDTWVSFFRKLNQSAADEPVIGSPAWALGDMFSLPKSTTRQWNMGVRAFLNDSLIYSSPGLDTTRMSYTYDLNGRRAVCYLSRWQEISTHWRIMRRAFWPILLLPLVLIIPFYRNYSLILKLTEPELRKPLNT